MYRPDALRSCLALLLLGGGFASLLPAPLAPKPPKACSASARGGSCASLDSALLQVRAARAKLGAGGVESIKSGDTVFLVSHLGHQITAQEDGKVHAEWDHRGVWEKFVVELKDAYLDGSRLNENIQSNASIFLKAWTGKLMSVNGTVVEACYSLPGPDFVFTVEREAGSGDVLDGDAVFLRSWTGKHLDVNGPFPAGGVQARWDDHGSWQRLIIEKVPTPASAPTPTPAPTLAPTAMPTPTPTSTPTPAMPELLRDGSTVMFKSWKGDYLHRLDDADGVTTRVAGTGNEWTVEVVEGNIIKLKSEKGDYLHKPDGEGVSTSGAGMGNEWTVEVVEGNVLKLKSWKGDYLHKPDGDGVSTLGAGMGIEWTLEPVQPTPAAETPAPTSAPTWEMFEWTFERVGQQEGKNVISLKSWKGDYLHKPDGERVSTSGAGMGNNWIVEGEAQVVKLKSWKGDYLHKPDGEGVSTSGAGMGNEWTVEPVQGKPNVIKLKSWKGDYLYKPDGDGVSTAAYVPAPTSAPSRIEWTYESVGGFVLQLKSWKGDYLHRLDDGDGVTTMGAGTGNAWTSEVVKPGVIKLKSEKGDYLHKPDGEGVSTSGAGMGNEWTVEIVQGKSNVIKLKSWKGDYLYKPDGDGVSTGNE